MPSVPHPYDNTARPAVHASYRGRTAERPTPAAPPSRGGERAGHPPAPTPPTSETAVSQADGAA